MKKSKLPNTQILTKLLQKFTQQELASIYGVNERTIRRHLKLSNKPKQKRGRKRKFEDDSLDTLRDYAISYLVPFQIITQKFLAKKFSCSQSTICLSLRRARVVYKKITYQSSEQSRKKNKARIEEFINKTIPSLLQSNTNIFFLDECSFHLNLAPRRGYCLKGSRLVGQRPGNKGKNQSLILLIRISNGEKIIHRRLVEGGVNSEVFHNFLSDFNPPNNGRENCLIMDNLSVHKANQSCIDLKLLPIKELLVSKNIEPIYLPPYTPELNPVEKMFNIIRQYVEKMQAREKDKLKLVIEEKLVFFQQEETTKYLKSSIKECLMKNNKICQKTTRKRMRGAFICYDYKAIRLIGWPTLKW
jgi:transposase